ncbi:MAG: metallophosphoesterase [Oscillibacter sp.]|nr:metallophosphoesterase [Oscillibacter sp.]
MLWLRRLLGVALFLLFCAAFFRWSNHSLQVAKWEAAFPDLPEGFDGCRVAVLSDFHGASFGLDGRALYRKVARQKPDYILLLGDLEDSFRGPVEGYPETLAREFSALAPTYYVTGNHEWAIGDVPELKERLTVNGVRVLSNEFVALERGGDVVVLAGIDDPNGYADQKSPEGVAADLYAAYGDPFWILLAHRNNLFPTKYCYLGADLVLSGHAHGGLIRFPFTDGLVSTDRTWFPSWTAGFYEKNASRLFVTRGLGNAGKTFRLFNRPEIAVLTFRKA